MIKQTFAVAIIAIGSAVVAPNAVMAQLTQSDKAAVDAYRSTIKSAESGAASQDIEAAYFKIDAVQKALMCMQGDQEGTVLESLSDAEFTHLVHELPGVLISREDIVFVKADLAYFTRLATSHGDDADRAFFAALKATYPDSVWPVYIEQETDYSGCTRFGSMSLVDAYQTWSEFQHKYPGRYTAAAQQEVHAILRELTGSTCACGNLEAVEKELQRFNRRFPTSAARGKVDQRLQDIGAHRSGIRANCIAE